MIENEIKQLEDIAENGCGCIDCNHCPIKVECDEINDEVVDISDGHINFEGLPKSMKLIARLKLASVKGG